MDDKSASSSPESLPVSLFFGLLFAGAALISLSNFLPHSSDYILEQHGFRQTQTAVTVYWFLRDGFRLDYPMPVVGAPWSVPFELPLFQLLTAWFVKLLGSSIDTAGRTVSFVFLLATLWPIWLLGRILRLPRAFFPASGALYLCSPLYLFWGKAFLIESLALFLTLLFLALALDVLLSQSREKRTLSLVAITITGILAVTVKVTTAFPVILLVGLLLAYQILQSWWHGRSEDESSQGTVWHWELLPSLALVLVSLKLWTSFCDSVKKAGEISSQLVSTNLRGFIFGSLRDRFGQELWRATILDRAIPEALGAGAPILLGIAIAALSRRKERVVIGVSVLLFLGTFLIFTNVHIRHNYYQCANAIYLILAGGLILSTLAETRPGPAIVAGLVIVTLELSTFRSGYRNLQGSIPDPRSSRILPIAHTLKNVVDPDAAILAFGCEWSGELAYYSERKAVTVPDWYTDPPEAARQPARFLGGTRLGAVVVCPEAKHIVGLAPAIEKLTRDARHDQIAGCDVFTRLRPSS